MAKKLGFKLDQVKPMSIISGGCHKLEAPFVCKGFTWSMHNHEFTVDFIVLPYICCDLILGVQWLKSLGPILWDIDKLHMEFSVHDKKVFLRAAKPATVKLISNEALNTAVVHGAELCFLQVDHATPQFIIPSCSVSQIGNSTSIVPKEIELLVVKFNDNFKEPTDLPPSKPGFDHKIPLKEGATPVNMCPYRYSIVQKDIVDILVGEMLNRGVIQYSNSLFASPTVLVRKKDGS